MTQTVDAPTRIDPDSRLLLASCDSHTGPRMVDLRPYCPSEHLEAFDAYAAEQEERFKADTRRQLFDRSNQSDEAEARARQIERNRLTAGHYDVGQRLRDMDVDGIVTEVLFHGSNSEHIPFVPGGFDFFFEPTHGDLEVAAIGLHIYNAWLADQCAVAPHRLIGLAHLPMWNPAAAVAEVEWARDHGLRGVNLPAPRPGLAWYDEDVWEPFWSVCAEADLSLNTHAGAGDMSRFANRRHAICLLQMEIGGWPSRRALHWMMFGGVFARHPGLKLVVTEQNGDWWPAAMREFDSSWRANRGILGDQVPRPPSEYCREQVFIGASFLAPFEAQRAIDHDYATNVMWGSDYPHTEGTWQYRDHDDAPVFTRLSLRHTFAAIPAEYTRLMASENAIRVYGLDREAMAATAEGIGSPTFAELATPLDEVPQGTPSMGFRTFGPWG